MLNNIEATNVVSLVATKNEPRVDSRLLAQSMGNRHKNVIELIERYGDKLGRFGKVAFQTEPFASGQKERYALLNEDQAFFLLTLVRNSDRTVELKHRLVKAFGEARRAAVQHGAEYLPTYHQLHDEIHALVAGSENERFVHMNINKLVNKVAGVDAGHRSGAAPSQQAMLIVGQAIAAKAVRGASDHRDGYQRAKSALLALSNVAMLEVQP